jgi:hypothetical protein
MYKSRNSSLKNVFFVFLKIGTFAFGGVYSMLALFEKELVEKHKWITREEFVESVALGQMTPGPPIINTGICIGYKLKKIKGALATTAGQTLTYSSTPVSNFLCKTRATFMGPIMKVGAAVGLLLPLFTRWQNTIQDYKAALFAATLYCT